MDQSWHANAPRAAARRRTMLGDPCATPLFFLLLFHPGVLGAPLRRIYLLLCIFLPSRYFSRLSSFFVTSAFLISLLLLFFFLYTGNVPLSRLFSFPSHTVYRFNTLSIIFYLICTFISLSDFWQSLLARQDLLAMILTHLLLHRSHDRALKIWIYGGDFD